MAPGFLLVISPMITQDNIREHNTRLFLSHLIIQRGLHEKKLKSESEKRRRERVKLDPERLERKRATGRRNAVIFREKLRSDPDKYREFLEKTAEKSRELYAENRKDSAFVEYHRKRIREYNKTDKGREIQRKQMAKCRENVQFRIAGQCRSRICDAIKGNRKAGPTEELIGCTINELMIHLESQFTDGMSWDNWGNGFGKWNMDHMAPCASFDLSDPEQQKKCFNYSNMRPLWAIENSAKNSIVDGVKQYYSTHQNA